MQEGRRGVHEKGVMGCIGMICVFLTQREYEKIEQKKRIKGNRKRGSFFCRISVKYNSPVFWQ